MERLARAVGVRHDADLARLLGISTSDFSQRKGRGKVPWDRIIGVANLRSISVDWLLTGIGEMSRAAPAAAVDEARADAVAEESGGEELPTSAQPPARKEFGRRLAALAGLLDQIDPDHSEAIIADALSRATDAQRLAELEQAIQQFKKEAKRRA